MLKRLKRAEREEKEFIRIPRSVSDLIPLDMIWKDGITKTGNRFSMTFTFSDTGYETMSDEKKAAVFSEYCGFINSLETYATTKLTLIRNRATEKTADRLMMEMKDDGLDHIREMRNSLVRERIDAEPLRTVSRYLTVSAVIKDHDQAVSYFDRFLSGMRDIFSGFGSEIRALDADERMSIFKDFFTEGNGREDLSFDEAVRKGISVKDLCCPSSFKASRDHMEMGDKYARALYLMRYPVKAYDRILFDLLDTDDTLLISMDLLPVPSEEAVREINKRLLATETEIAGWQRKQNRNNNFSATVPYEFDLIRRESEEFLNELTQKDQQMVLGLITMLIKADSMDELETKTDMLKSVGRNQSFIIETLGLEQTDGLMTALPFGVMRIGDIRTLTTESAAVFMPFRTAEVRHENGVFMGRNPLSGDIITVNRERLLNGNGMILGTSGSGKSMFAKYDMIENRLMGHDIIIIDPESEYGRIAEAMGGQVIRIAPDSGNHINAFDISGEGETGDNPVLNKSAFILSFMEQLISGRPLSNSDRSVIDRCVGELYGKYFFGRERRKPTLLDFYKELMRQEEKNAKDLALAIELYASGSLDMFAKDTNVDISSPLISFDIRDMGAAMKTAGMLVIIDMINSRILDNFRKGRRTFIYIDEIYLLFKNEYSSSFLFEQWKRARKYGAFYTGISQNVTDLLASETAKTMLANSELTAFFSQAGSDRKELGSLMGLSDEQLMLLTDAKAGEGILRVGRDIIPFSCRMGNRNGLYALMTTRPGEADRYREQKTYKVDRRDEETAQRSNRTLYR